MKEGRKKIRATEGYVRNYDFIKINSIGKEEAMVEKYVRKIVELFKMNLGKSKTRTTADTATLGIEKSRIFISHSKS